MIERTGPPVSPSESRNLNKGRLDKVTKRRKAWDANSEKRVLLAKGYTET